MMNGRGKISARHLDRLAVVYVRQSSTRQVLENRESTDRQYALRDHALALGWPSERIVTIDADLGVSGSTSGGRKGYERLKQEVSRGRVGAVLGLEVSRFSRNAVDWFQLLEWCRATDTLLIEGEQVFSPARHDDALVLSIKGSLSESELTLLRARMRGGAMNKARRGALYHNLPAGFLLEGDRLVKDPDRQVRHAIGEVFARFREQGSARRVTASLLDDGVRLPVRTPGREIEWDDAAYGRVIGILKNPMMGGAYAYGRERSERVLDDAGVPRTTKRKVSRDDWHVLIEDHHEGYVSWQDWLGIQERLSANAISREPREGAALLQTLATCGHCGRRLHTRYARGWSYMCPRPMDGSRKSCMNVGGARIDAVVERAFLDAVSPAGVEAARLAARQSAKRDDAGLRSLQLEVERCRHEAGLAERRYCKIDPDNRLVADTLERDWEMALRALEEAGRALDHARQSQAPPPDPARLEALGERVDVLWHADGVTPRDRKRLLACLVEDVMLRIDRDVGAVGIVVHWKGGECDEFTVPLQRRRSVPEDGTDTVELVRQLVGLYNDDEISGVLNQRGRVTPKGLPFNRDRVQRLRKRHGIPAHARKAGDGKAPVVGVLEASRQLEVSESTLYRWIREGLIAAEPTLAGAPCRIRLTDALRQRFRAEPPEGFVPARMAARRLGVSRQRIWQRIRDGDLQACHINRGPDRGLFVQLGESAASLPGLFADVPDNPEGGR